MPTIRRSLFEDDNPSNPQLKAAIEGEPWSLSGVIVGLGSLLDDEGRPLGERRAPAASKEQVTMDLKPCPYRDERFRRSMNASALEQITRHFEGAMTDLARFRASLPADRPTWDDVYVAMVDQMARPAVHLLAGRDPYAAVPAPISVGYKIAAGFSSPLRHMLELEAAGLAQAVTEDELLDTVRAKKLLVGAGEVCAGPPAMIARVTGILIHGAPVEGPPVAADRVAVARTLTLQTRVGIAWRLFDISCERDLLLGETGKENLRPRNKHLSRVLRERTEALSGIPAYRAARLPAALDEEDASALRAVLDLTPEHEQGPNPAASGVSKRIAALLESEDGAVAIDPRARQRFASRFAAYLDAYRAVSRVLRQLERRHRRALGYPEDAPIKLSRATFPIPKALCWFERVLGYRLLADEERGVYSLKSLEQTVAI